MTPTPRSGLLNTPGSLAHVCWESLERRFAQTTEWPTERAPRPLAAREVKFPPFQVKTLSNGMQVITVAHHEQPAVTMRLLVRAGAAQDRRTRADSPSSSRSCSIRDDDAKRSRSRIRSIRSAARWAPGRADLTFVNAVVMKDSFALAMDLVHDVVRHPAFSPEEIERQREQALSSLRVSGEDPSYVASMLFDRLIYGFHPWEAGQRPTSSLRASRRTICGRSTASISCRTT